jgi:hypothetical protein
MIRKNDPVAEAFAAMKTGGDSRQTEKARKQKPRPYGRGFCFDMADAALPYLK